MQESIDELYKLIGSVHANNPYLNFKTKPDLLLKSYQAMAKYSFYIIK